MPYHINQNCLNEIEKEIRSAVRSYAVTRCVLLVISAISFIGGTILFFLECFGALPLKNGALIPSCFMVGSLMAGLAIFWCPLSASVKVNRLNSQPQNISDQMSQDQQL